MARSLTADVACEQRSEMVPPNPHDLVADVDPALEQLSNSTMTAPKIGLRQEIAHLKYVQANGLNWFGLAGQIPFHLLCILHSTAVPMPMHMSSESLLVILFVGVVAG